MNILKFFQTQEIPLIIARIISKPNDSQCLVQDAKSRQYIAESDGTYTVGQTVIIKNGVITSSTKSLSSFKEFVI